MKESVCILWAILLGFGCQNQSSGVSKKDSTPDSSIVAKDIRHFPIDTTAYLYTIMSGSGTSVKLIGSLMFCSSPGIDDKSDYVLADKATKEYICLSRNSLNAENQISTITMGYSGFLDSHCDIHYSKLPQLVSNDSIKLGMSIQEVIARAGKKYSSSSCDTCNYKTTLYYCYREKEFPFIAKKYGMPLYERQFWFDGNGKLMKYSFGFPHP